MIYCSNILSKNLYNIFYCMNLTINWLIDWFSDVHKEGGVILKKKAKIQEILSLRPLVVQHPLKVVVYTTVDWLFWKAFFIWILTNYSLAPVDESKIHTHFTCTVYMTFICIWCASTYGVNFWISNLNLKTSLELT